MVASLAMVSAVTCAVALPIVGYPSAPKSDRAPAHLAQTALRIGSRAPAFVLPAADGTMWSLDARPGGDRAVVIFYRGNWCPYGRRQLADVQASLRELTRLGASVVAVSADSVEASAKTAAELGLSFPVLSDPKSKLIRAFGAADSTDTIAWPSVFVLDDGDRVSWRAIESSYGATFPARRIVDALRM